MTNVIADLAVRLTANMSDVNAKFRQLDTDLKKSSDGFAAMGSRLTSLGTKLTLGVTAALVGAGVAAFKFATDFNAAMANVATLIPGNAERVKELKSAVQGMAVEVGKSTGDLAGGLYQVISAFGDSSETAKLLEINAKAAAAGLSTTLEAINLTSAVTKGYGDVTAEAAQKAADLAFVTVKLGQTTFPELAGAIGSVVPLAATLGVAQEELFAGFATLTGVTGNAAEVSTQLAGILRAMIRPTEDMKKAIAALGYESAQAMVQELGMVGSLRALIGTTDGSQEAIGKLVMRAEALTSIFALNGGQAETFDQKLAAMADTTGATTEAFKEQTEGINAAGFQWSQFKTRIAVVTEKFGDALLPALSKLLDLLEPVVGWVGKMAEKFANLPTPLQSAVIGILALAAAAGPMLIIAGQLVTAWGSVSAVLGIGKGAGLIGALTKAGGALKSFMALLPALVGPIGIAVGVIAGLAAAGYLVYTNWEDIKALLSGLWTDISNVASAVWGGIRDFLGGVWDVIAEKFTDTWDWIADKASVVWEPLADFFVGIWDSVSTVFVKVWEGLADFLGGIWDAVAETAKSIWNWIVEKINWALEKLGKILPNTVKALKSWGDESKKTEKEVGKLAKTSEDAEKPLKPLRKGIEDTKDETKEYEKALKDWEKASKEASKEAGEQWSKLWRLRQEVREAEKAQAAYNEEITSGRAWEAANKITQSLSEMTRAGLDVRQMAGPIEEITQALGGMTVKTDELAAAFARQHVQSATSLTALADQAEADYRRIKDSGIAEGNELAQFELAALKARVEAQKAYGIAVTEEQKRQIGVLEDQLGQHAEKEKDIWASLKNQVSTIFTDLGKSLTDILWGEGGGSIKSKFVDMFKEMGKSVTRFVIEYLEGKLFKAFASLLDNIFPSISKALGGLFGFGGGGAAAGGTATDTVAGGAGSVAGGASGEGGFAGSPMPGMFQAANQLIGFWKMVTSQQDKDIGELARTAIKCEIHLKSLLDLGWIVHDWILNIRTVLYEHIHTRLEEIRDHLNRIELFILPDIASGLNNALVPGVNNIWSRVGELTHALNLKADTLYQGIVPRLDQIASQPRANITINVAVGGTSSTADDIANAIANSLRSQGLAS